MGHESIRNGLLIAEATCLSPLHRLPLRLFFIGRFGSSRADLLLCTRTHRWTPATPGQRPHYTGTGFNLVQFRPPRTCGQSRLQSGIWNFWSAVGGKKNLGDIRDLWPGTGNISCVGKRRTYHVAAGGNYWVSHTHTLLSRSRRLHSPDRVYFHLCRQKWDSFLFVQRPTLYSSRTWNNYITRFFFQLVQR